VHKIHQSTNLLVASYMKVQLLQCTIK